METHTIAHSQFSKAAICSISSTDYVLRRAHTHVAELNPKIISSLLEEEIALIAKVTLALQAPVFANSYLPNASGVIQLSQPFPAFGFTNPKQQFNSVCELVHIALLQL